MEKEYIIRERVVIIFFNIKIINILRFACEV